MTELLAIATRGAMSIIALFIILIAIGGLATGLANINLLHEFSAETVFLSLIGSLPLLMVIYTVGIFAAVLFQIVRGGVGVANAFVFAQFFLDPFIKFSKSLE